MSLIHTTSHALRDTASLIERFTALKPAVAKTIRTTQSRIAAQPDLNAAYEAASKAIVPALYAGRSWVSQFEVREACDRFYKHGAESCARKKNRALLSRSKTSLERHARFLYSIIIDADYAIQKIDCELERVGNWAYPALTADDHSALRAFRADLERLKFDVTALRTEVLTAERSAFTAGLTAI